MSGELLAIIQAEERADAIVTKAEQRKERSLELAKEERERKLKDLKLPTPTSVTVEKPPSEVERIKRIALKNKEQAVQKILEAIHAA